MPGRRDGDAAHLLDTPPETLAAELIDTNVPRAALPVIRPASALRACPISIAPGRSS
jgi:hypothetical protein